MDAIWGIIINALALLLGAAVISGIKMRGFIHAVIIAFVIGLLNYFIGSILDWLATPINWISSGLFSFVIDALIIYLASKILSGFKVERFVDALLLAVIIALFNGLVQWWW